MFQSTGVGGLLSVGQGRKVERRKKDPTKVDDNINQVAKGKQPTDQTSGQEAAIAPQLRKQGGLTASQKSALNRIPGQRQKKAPKPPPHSRNEASSRPSISRSFLRQESTEKSVAPSVKIVSSGRFSEGVAEISDCERKIAMIKKMIPKLESLHQYECLKTVKTHLKKLKIELEFEKSNNELEEIQE